MADREKVIKRLECCIRKMDDQPIYLVTWGEDDRIGECPLCEQHNKRLYLVTGKADGKLSMDFICAECIHAIKVLKTLKALKHEVSRDA